MLETQAREYLEKLLPIVQKARSNGMEAGLSGELNRYVDVDMDTQMILEKMDKFLFHPKLNLVEQITRLLERKTIEPLNMYNLMMCADKSPIVVAQCFLMKFPLLEPSISIITEWGKETVIAYEEQPGE